MTRSFVCRVVAISCIASSAHAADAPRFEAAEIRSSAPATSFRNSFIQGPFVGGGRFEIRKATMLDLVRVGWSVQSDKIVGGPNWTDLDRFDILAKAPAGAKTADLRLMLQTLLADRFDLKVHNDTKPMPAFALVVAPGKKPHLKQADGTGDTGCKGQSSSSGEGSPQIMMSDADGKVTTLSILPGNLVHDHVCFRRRAAAIRGCRRRPQSCVG